jgi:hypothetical protein
MAGFQEFGESDLFSWRMFQGSWKFRLRTCRFWFEAKSRMRRRETIGGVGMCLSKTSIQWRFNAIHLLLTMTVLSHIAKLSPPLSHFGYWNPSRIDGWGVISERLRGENWIGRPVPSRLYTRGSTVDARERLLFQVHCMRLIIIIIHSTIPPLPKRR